MGLGLNDLTSVADALYSGRPDAFVADRKAAAAAARAAGDSALAKAITALRRPTQAAWCVNVAAHASLVSLREWLDLGRELRAATSGGDTAQIRVLNAQRTPLENRVIDDIGAHLAAQGTPASPAALTEARATLRAALSDEHSAAAVATGHLTATLTYAGFGDVAFPMAPSTPAPSPTAVTETVDADPAAAMMAQARVLAEEAFALAGARTAEAEQKLTEAERAVADLETRVATLTDRLRSAQHSLGEQRRAARQASLDVRRTRQQHELARRKRDALNET